MHADELDIAGSLVRALLASQFPEWADLVIESVPSSGTDNAIFRLGDDMAVRLPRRPATIVQVEREQEWLPRFAPSLPLAIPVPLAKGQPGDGYPWPWSVYRWLEGSTPTVDDLVDPLGAAAALAEFVVAMRAIDPTGGPVPGPDNFGRGAPLVTRDARVRREIELIGARLDEPGASAAWDSALAAPEWEGLPVWIHGDLASGNLLAEDGRLTGVIDFGCMAVGDPACDLLVAWEFLPAQVRDVFRQAVDVDDAAWARGRGWALSVALMQIPYYERTNPDLVERSWRTIDAVLTDPDR